MASCAVMLAPLAAVDVGQSADLGLGPVPAGGGGGATTLSGDATGPATATVVAGINGATLGTTTPGGGNLLVGSGSQWISQAISGDVSMAANGAASVVGIKGTTIANNGAGFNFFMIAAGNGTAEWENISGDITSGGSYGSFSLVNSAQARTDIGLGTGNYTQFSGVTSTGPIFTQTLAATGASTLAGVTCTSVVDSGTETVNALSATGAATITGALTATGAATLAGGLTVEDPTDPTKKLTFSLSGGTTNVPITLAISANASARTYTIPTDSSDSFAMLGLSQTFTGYIKTTFVTDTTSTTTGSLLTSGGLAVAKGICDGGGFMDASNVASSFSTGGSATVAANVLTEINTNTSTIATFYLWLPAAPNNGQIIDFVTEGIISAITVGGNGHTIIAAPTSCTANTTYRWIYNSAATTWYREQ